jgi:hypothetical protein
MAFSLRQRRALRKLLRAIVGAKDSSLRLTANQKKFPVVKIDEWLLELHRGHAAERRSLVYVGRRWAEV